MFKALLIFVFLSTLLLTNCGQSSNTSDKTSNVAGQTANKEANANHEAKVANTPRQQLARKWKESVDDMYPASDSAKYDEFELKELKNVSDNSFYEFKTDSTYTITRPNEKSGTGKWQLGNKNKTLTLQPAKGNAQTIEVQMLSSEKIKLKFNDGFILILVPTK